MVKNNQVHDVCHDINKGWIQGSFQVMTEMTFVDTSKCHRGSNRTSESGEDAEMVPIRGCVGWGSVPDDPEFLCLWANRGPSSKFWEGCCAVCRCVIVIGL